MGLQPVDTATTLSIAFSPGQDIRFPITSSESIFTFGDYRIERSSEPEALTGTAQNLAFSPFSTLENMGANDFNPQITVSVKNNELRPVGSDPYSYSYFGSFYTEVARSINNILDTFPYAILAYNNEGDTLYDYSEQFNTITGEKLSSFKIPAEFLVNQGTILLNSGSTLGNQKSLMTQTNLFEIQLSATTTAQTNSYAIKSYSFTGGTYPVLEFEIYGHLSENAPLTFTGTTNQSPVYIRPSRKRMTEYKIQQSRLERQLLSDGIFDIPDIDDEKKNFRYKIQWPKNIDGFNPDTRGTDFEGYKNSMLLLAGNSDMDKTDIMIKTIIPENYLDFDTNTQIYRKLISSYAREFDEIKQFIDNIAYAHSINYNDEESIPKKFMVKLSNLFGWKLSSTFSEIDLFKYLSEDENNSNSFAYYNVEIWKRILININWLFKKKGTRDALQFLFKLMGAPESLVVFDEFIYEITSTLDSSLSASTIINTSKSNSRGFINYNASEFIFQEGGEGRGTGQKYIDQWRPEYDPLKKVNNIKVQVGDTGFTGSENIVNTKEVYATLSPASAIEFDVFKWYQQSGTCWVWGSFAPPFSANTVPFEYTIPNCEFVTPDTITGMTFNEYMEYIYSSNIEPRNRKTNIQTHTSWSYPELKRIYMNYYLLAEPQSNMLTIKKLEAFLGLMEVNFQSYLLQLIPATTILETQGTTYRNTIFNRQRFVYKEGINDGSEFQIPLPPDIRPTVIPIKISPKINDFINSNLCPIIITSGVSNGIKKSISAIKISAKINDNNFNVNIAAVDVDGNVNPGIQQITPSASVVPINPTFP